MDRWEWVPEWEGKFRAKDRETCRTLAIVGPRTRRGAFLGIGAVAEDPQGVDHDRSDFWSIEMAARWAESIMRGEGN
jgi:hypothetical protein